VQSIVPVTPNVRAKVGPTVWRAGTAAQNWGEAPAPQAQCATPLGLTLSEGLGSTSQVCLGLPGTLTLRRGGKWTINFHGLGKAALNHEIELIRSSPVHTAESSAVISERLL
jgi:hypothetical protein